MISHRPHFALPVPRRAALVRASRIASLLPLCLALLAPAAARAAPPAGGAAAAFHQLNDDNWIERRETLSTLGFTTPLVLASNDSSREIYLPVPANVPLADAALKMDASYLRADGGRTTMVLAVDTFPVAARAMTADQGNAGLTLGIDGAPRANGFVRLSVNWSTMLSGQTQCSDPRTPGNVLRVEPGSSFSYRYDSRAVGDLRTAWGALPAVTAIMVAGRQLDAQSYDTAWRIGVALERAGKHSTVSTMPVVGDRIDLSRLKVPAALRAIPAFAALSGEGTHVLKDQAEIGALLSLGQNGFDGQLRGDILVGDKALLDSINGALDALAAQVGASASDAAAAFAQWRTRLQPRADGLQPSELRLVSAFGRPVILAGPQSGAAFASMFDAYWRNISGSPALVARAAHKPVSQEPYILLKNLGGAPGSFDVMSRADWTASFDIAEVASDGRLPSELVLDVSAAPGAGRTPPVVSVFLNDVLLGASHLQANGQRERINARIPPNALAAQNQIKVAFVRQPSSDNCRETPQSFPVAVLASSHIKLDKAKDEANFTGMVRRFATGAELLVPKAYLSDSAATLQRVVMVAASTGLPAGRTTMKVVDDGAQAAPSGNFLAFDTGFKDDKSLVVVKQNTLVLNDSSNKPMLDVSGFNRLGIVEVTQASGHDGVVWRSVGQSAPAVAKPFQLSSGNVAAIGNAGLLSEINTSDTSGRDYVQDAPSITIPDILWWVVPLSIIALFVLMLVLASRARRRRAAEQERAREAGLQQKKRDQ
ncbi:cellulose biosynthesis cyclic di-GMP-binding regulatory protein BcsB [Herbaspirillum sp. alder98]|uniref:cellulose biosynthesis cyclic di-GMP-binding regulatory protein BcsB n=1 Tax=Herbaspirillum sp. alder98 TaxID=2913096 RepID=UPI001CD84A68|nr:cellulose biosynthesis cyclic di-GMP-binding regulatory protein BcsB [Herbaspirillum sp. alder98]MCA1325871.1 cellulose biosynthesis cyclic di-GMP-binding regulatory protein BcsB [Herbaspirillum sp. alder98]